MFRIHHTKFSRLVFTKHYTLYSTLTTLYCRQIIIHNYPKPPFTKYWRFLLNKNLAIWTGNNIAIYNSHTNTLKSQHQQQQLKITNVIPTFIVIKLKLCFHWHLCRGQHRSHRISGCGFLLMRSLTLRPVQADKFPLYVCRPYAGMMSVPPFCS